MKLTAQVKLVVTEVQANALKGTLARANAACDSICAWVWEHQTFGQYALHKGTYAATRAAFDLTAQVVVRCNAKVADAYKLDKKVPRTLKPDGAIAYDDRILRWYMDKGEVSIWSVAGRLRLPFVCGDYQRGLLASQQGESDLAFHGGNFYLLTTCNLPEPPLVKTDGVLGVDLGIVNLATDSEGRSYSGKAVKACRRRARRIRSLLQSRGTKNAKRHLKRMGRRTANYQKWVNHNISRHLVRNALSSRKALALEALTGIRERGNGFNREMKWQLGNWAFFQLGQFVAYKAKRAGIPVTFVDPRDTSRICHACGHCAKGNRKSQSVFQCLSCGLCADADENAAINIGVRGDVSRPIDAPALG